MDVIILAAGLGQRLGGLTAAAPKAMIGVNGRRLIDYVLDFTDHPLVTRRILVTGYEADRLVEHVRGRDLPVEAVHNPHYRDGSIRSIETAIEFAKDDLLIMNVDHIYPKRMQERVFVLRDRITAMCDTDRTLLADDMKVKRSPAGQLMGIRKTLTDFDCGYIGMTFVPRAALSLYRETIGRVRKAEGDAVAVEMVLGRLSAEGVPIDVCDVSGIGWLEVDTPEDRAHAEHVLSTQSGFMS